MQDASYRGVYKNCEGPGSSLLRLEWETVGRRITEASD